MKAKIQIIGISNLIKDINRATVAGNEVAAGAVENLANGTARIARDRISSGQGSSAPGGYPNSKTGRLERSISVVLKQAKRTTALVGTAQLHGRFLEFGTASMEPRPWLLPSFEAAQDSELGGLAAEFEGRL